MNRIDQANNLVKIMISTLAKLENNIHITNDIDLKTLHVCNAELESFLNKQLYYEEENL